MDLELIAAPPLDEFPWIETVPPDQAVGGAGGTLTSGLIYLKRVRRRQALRVTQAIVFVITASGNIDPCVYSSDGTTLTRIASSGGTAVAGASQKQAIALSAALDVPLGVDFYVGVVLDNATASLFRANFAISGASAIAVEDNVILSKASSYPAPASLTISAMAGIAALPWVRFKP